MIVKDVIDGKLLLDDGMIIEVIPASLSDDIKGAFIFNIIFHPNTRKLVFLTDKNSYNIEGVESYVYRYDQRN